MPIFVHSQSRKKGVAIKFFEEGGDAQGHVKRKIMTFYFVYPNHLCLALDAEKYPCQWLI